MSYLILPYAEVRLEGIVPFPEVRYKALLKSYPICPLCYHMWDWHFTPSYHDESTTLWYPHTCAADHRPPVSCIGFCQCPFAIDDSLE